MPPAWILFKGETKPVRLDQMSGLQETMLENGRPHTYVKVDDQGQVLDPEHGPRDTLETTLVLNSDSGSEQGWEVVADADVSQEEIIASQVMDAAETLGSDADSAEAEDDAAHDDGDNVFDRVKRFEANMEQEHAAQDPFWLETFFDIIEKVDEVPGRPIPVAGASAPNYQAALSILSGCSGMAAEGWVCKAGLVIMVSVLFLNDQQ